MPRDNNREEEREERIRELMERARKQMPPKTGNGGKPKPKPKPQKVRKAPRKPKTK